MYSTQINIVHRAKQLTKKFPSSMFEIILIWTLCPTHEMKPMNFVPLPANDSLSVKKLCVPITKLHPLLPRFLKPHKFFLGHHKIILLQQFLFHLYKKWRILLLKFLLNMSPSLAQTAIQVRDLTPLFNRTKTAWWFELTRVHRNHKITEAITEIAFKKLIWCHVYFRRLI